MTPQSLLEIAGIPVTSANIARLTPLAEGVQFNGEYITANSWSIVDLTDGSLIAGPDTTPTDLEGVWDEQYYSDYGKLITYPNSTDGMVLIYGEDLIKWIAANPDKA